jgi:hypothetical protein
LRFHGGDQLELPLNDDAAIINMALSQREALGMPDQAGRIG